MLNAKSIQSFPRIHKKNLIEVRKKGGCKEVSEEACGVVRYDDLHDVM